VKLAGDAPPPTDWPAGETVNVHGAPTCETVNVCPAIVNDPTRSPPLFAATESDTDPSPLPEAPPVTVIQLSLLVAVHEQ
jgi:hypothetical protein